MCLFSDCVAFSHHPLPPTLLLCSFFHALLVAHSHLTVTNAAPSRSARAGFAWPRVASRWCRGLRPCRNESYGCLIASPLSCAITSLCILCLCGGSDVRIVVQNNLKMKNTKRVESILCQNSEGEEECQDGGLLTRSYITYKTNDVYSCCWHASAALHSKMCSPATAGEGDIQKFLFHFSQAIHPTSPVTVWSCLSITYMDTYVE